MERLFRGITWLHGNSVVLPDGLATSDCLFVFVCIFLLSSPLLSVCVSIQRGPCPPLCFFASFRNVVLGVCARATVAS